MFIAPRIRMANPGVRRLARAVLVGLTVMLALFALLPGWLGPANADELRDARNRREALEDRIAAQKARVERLDSLQSELELEIDGATVALRSVNADLSAVRSQVGSIKESIAAVRAEYEQLVEELRLLDRDVDELQREQRFQQEQRRDRLDSLAERIRASYESSQTSLFEAFLSVRSFTDLLAEAGAFLDGAEQDRQLAEEIRQDQEVLAGLEATLLATRAETDALRRSAVAQRRRLDRRLDDLRAAQSSLARLERATQRELATQRATFARLEQSESALREAIAANAAAQRKLQRRIDALVREQQKDGRIPSQYSQSLTWPHRGRITQEFGCTGFPWEPPLGNCRNFHRGIDIAAPRWTPVRATGDGVVVFAGPNPYDPSPKAWIVIIAHSQSLRTWYAHVDNERPPTVRAGQSVRQGQVIAYVGSTGRSTGYHTDWRVELRGTFMNPRLFL